MGYWEAIILGIVQGLTEFLPVSSSGHLAVGQQLLGIQAKDDLLFEVIVHVGTLGAVIWVYRSSFARYWTDALQLLSGKSEAAGSFFDKCKATASMREIFWICVATVPTGIIGVVFRKKLKAAFGSMTAVAILFAVTGVILIVTLKSSDGEEEIADMGWLRALLIGFAQGIAILPGISRSGTTIACALLLGMKRDEAARFSFLIAIPAISGATLLELRKLEAVDSSILPLLAGGLVSAAVGYLALRFLIRLVQEGKLAWFAIYLWLLSAGILAKLYMF